MRRRSMIALLLAVGLTAACEPARAEPPVWTVRDADSEMILFGSVHLLPPGLDWRPDALEAGLAQADDLWFELPVDAASDAQGAAAALRLGRLPAGESLPDLLSVEGRERLARVGALYGAPPQLLAGVKPWLAEVMLATLAFGRAGATTDQGVERQISLTAPPDVARRAFETAEEQIAMFAAAPLEEQVASLEESLEQLETDPEQFDRLVAAWMAGDVATLEDEALDPLREAAPGIYQRMVVARNMAWMEPLTARLDGRGTTVVVVGVGHLIGPDGLPERLRALGYAVEGP
ncbi:MAG: TraB/GumN family protein [Pseudomonadota bacterium]